MLVLAPSSPERDYSNEHEFDGSHNVLTIATNARVARP